MEVFNKINFWHNHVLGFVCFSFLICYGHAYNFLFCVGGGGVLFFHVGMWFLERKHISMANQWDPIEEIRLVVANDMNQ